MFAVFHQLRPIFERVIVVTIAVRGARLTICRGVVGNLRRTARRRAAVQASGRRWRRLVALCRGTRWWLLIFDRCCCTIVRVAESGGGGGVVVQRGGRVVVHLLAGLDLVGQFVERVQIGFHFHLSDRTIHLIGEFGGRLRASWAINL